MLTVVGCRVRVTRSGRARTASAVAGWPTSACSTPVARIGVVPMFVSPTRASEMVPPSTLMAAATAHMDHACAVRLNFS
jgi:hypothetical protein